MIHRGVVCLVLLVGGVLGCAEESQIEPLAEPRAPVEAKAMVDRAIATTGDVITYRLEVDADAAYDVEIPEVGADIAGFRIVDIGSEEPRERGGRILRERWYQLRADLVGSYVLPSVQIRFRRVDPESVGAEEWQSVTTAEIFVEVETVLPTNLEAEDLRGLKPLRRVRTPISWALIAWIILGVAVVVAVLIWYLRRRVASPSRPLIPAHELAFQALDSLRRTDFDDPESVRRFYFQISEVVRTYVEGRYEMNATDLTTEEIVDHLGDLTDLSVEQNQQFRHFLVNTDQVKFAHREPSQTDVEFTYEQALGFVEATRPLPETAAQEAA